MLLFTRMRIQAQAFLLEILYLFSLPIDCGRVIVARFVALIPFAFKLTTEIGQSLKGRLKSRRRIFNQK